MSENMESAQSFIMCRSILLWGGKFGTFVGEDRYTTKESDRLIRLPMWYGISEEEVEEIVGKVSDAIERCGN